MKVNVGCGELLLEGYLNIDKYDDRADRMIDPLGLEMVDVDEVRMDHCLEHVGIHEAQPLLYHVAQWLRPSGKLVVEVPDMEAIMAAPGPNWVTDVYGVQIHEGEFHRSGWNVDKLTDAVFAAGCIPDEIKRFLSEHPYRRGMPCIKVEATKR